MCSQTRVHAQHIVAQHMESMDLNTIFEDAAAALSAVCPSGVELMQLAMLCACSASLKPLWLSECAGFDDEEDTAVLQELIYDWDSTLVITNIMMLWWLKFELWMLIPGQYAFECQI